MGNRDELFFLLDLLLVIGAAGGFAWWQLRDLAREKQKSARLRSTQWPPDAEAAAMTPECLDQRGPAFRAEIRVPSCRAGTLFNRSSRAARAGRLHAAAHRFSLAVGGGISWLLEPQVTLVRVQHGMSKRGVCLYVDQ